MPKIRTRRLTIISPLIFFIPLFIGCNHTKGSQRGMEKEVAYIMSERENAITNKDIGLYMKCISKDYRDNADTFDTIRQKMQKNFEIFDRIEFSTSNRTIYPNGLTVMIVQDYELVFFVSGERKYISGKERIFLLKENTGWKIIKGL